jgi:hypothetical protein
MEQVIISRISDDCYREHIEKEGAIYHRLLDFLDDLALAQSFEVGPFSVKAEAERVRRAAFGAAYQRLGWARGSLETHVRLFDGLWWVFGKRISAERRDE